MKLKDQQQSLLHPHVKAEDMKHQFRDHHHHLHKDSSRHHEGESELMKLGRTWDADKEFENADKVYYNIKFTCHRYHKLFDVLFYTFLLLIY